VTVLMDRVVTPVLTDLLACLGTALGGTAAGPVGALMLVPGASATTDYCCSDSGTNGQGWVRLVGITPVLATNNQTYPAYGSCDANRWVVQVEMGAYRCAPTSDDDGNPPTPDELTAAAQVLADDAAAMRRAICCLTSLPKWGPDSDTELAYTRGAWAPVPTAGGCMGGTQLFSFEINDCCPVEGS